MGEWNYSHPVKIIAGGGSLERLPSVLPETGAILLVTSEGWVRRGVAQRIEGIVGSDRLLISSGVNPNPQLDALDLIIRDYLDANLAAIIGLGGGSAIDAAKVIAAGVVMDLENPLDAIFRRGRNQPWQSSLPLVAVPTTAGTGAEVTPFATVWDEITKKKFSVAGEAIFPSAAILESELTLSLPRKATLFTALDATSHALESIWNHSRSPISEALASQALMIIAESLPVVLADSECPEARDRLLTASTLAGMAISHTKTAIAHSVSYPLTIHHGVPHGLAASFLLPNLIKVHLDAEANSVISGIFEKVLALLARLNLSEELRNYVEPKAVFNLVDEMFEPSRAANYTHSMDRDRLEGMLRDALDEG